MKFGIFDHGGRASRTTGETFADLIKLVQRAEQAGFYAFHLAEHHGSPLSVIPSPGVFLAALSQHTSKIRLGTLVLLLPFHDPYRLVGEVCMLDHLSGGRFDLGIGRPGNPVELGFHGITPEISMERFQEAYEILLQGLTEGYIDYQGQHYAYDNVPLADGPLQQPHPPIWYPTASAQGLLPWAAKQGHHTIIAGPVDRCAVTIKAYRDSFIAGANGDEPIIGLQRYTFVAESEEEAFRVGREAYHYAHEKLTRLLRRANFDMSAIPVFPPDNLDDAFRDGWAIVGRPADVCDQVAEQADKTGNNYVVTYPKIGNIGIEVALRTVEMFEAEVIPNFQESAAAS